MTLGDNRFAITLADTAGADELRKTSPRKTLLRRCGGLAPFAKPAGMREYVGTGDP